MEAPVIAIGIFILLGVLGARYINQYRTESHNRPRSDSHRIATTINKRTDKEEIHTLLKNFEAAVNENDITKVLQYISLSNTTLRTSFTKMFTDGELRYVLGLTFLGLFLRQIDTQTYKVTLFQSVYGNLWHMTGIPSFFKIQFRNGRWLIIDTNMPERMSKKFALKLFGIIFAIVLGFGALIFLSGLLFKRS